jgi:hypothetical protein
VLRSSRGPTPTVLREPIREFLKDEIAEPTVEQGQTEPALGLAAALDVLNSWKDPADTPLLLEYLKHPAHTTAPTRVNGRPAEFVKYEIRARVRDMLKGRGVNLPPGIVYQEEVEAENGGR